MVHAGGRAGLGSHGQLQGLGAHWETWNLASGGLTPHETLQVVTMYSAEAIGLQQDLGSLEAGKLADLLVLDRNPLENIKNTNSIRYVMKNGELYEADTLNMVWPQPKPLPKQFWWDTEPARSSDRQMSDCRSNDSRTADGVLAKLRRNVSVKWLWLEKPSSNAMAGQIDAPIAQVLERRAQAQLVAVGVQRKTRCAP